MSVKSLLATCALLMIGALAKAQGFAGLGAEAEGFALPDRNYEMQFPQDHGPHPEFRIEWWYVTANLVDENGRDYGVQWTLFRSALSPDQSGAGWETPQMWMGNAALTSSDAHYVAQKLARGGIGQAGAQAVPFQVWIDDWQMAGRDVSNVMLTASGAGFSYELELTAETPLVLHGDNGYSVKSSGGQASHYYSQPAYAVSGTLELPDGPVAVAGEAWLDREWYSQPLSSEQFGWDWVGLSFETGDKLMAGRVREGDKIFAVATWIGRDGRVTPYDGGAVVLTPIEQSTVAGRKLPTRWRVDLAAEGVSVEVTALNPNSWMATLIPYWEGPVKVSGSHNGRGYLEMTGY